MQHTVLRLRGVRMAVVLVEKCQLKDDLVSQIQNQLALPVMLIAKDDANWKGLRTRAQFDAAPFLSELLAAGDELEWTELGEPELPF